MLVPRASTLLDRSGSTATGCGGLELAITFTWLPFMGAIGKDITAGPWRRKGGSTACSTKSAFF